MRITLVFIALTLFACNKDASTTTPTPTPTPTTCFTISGITETDDNGNYFGNIDSSDWKMTDHWSSCEQSLLGTVNYISGCVFSDTMTTNIQAWPNPTSNMFRLHEGIVSLDTNQLAVDTTIAVDIYIVNQSHQLLGTIHTNKRNLNNFTFSLNTIDPNASDSLFRIYYKLTDPNNCVLTGCGDLLRRP